MLTILLLKTTDQFYRLLFPFPPQLPDPPFFLMLCSSPFLCPIFRSRFDELLPDLLLPFVDFLKLFLFDISFI